MLSQDPLVDISDCCMKCPGILGLVKQTRPREFAAAYSYLHLDAESCLACWDPQESLVSRCLIRRSWSARSRPTSFLRVWWILQSFTALQGRFWAHTIARWRHRWSWRACTGKWGIWIHLLRLDPECYHWVWLDLGLVLLRLSAVPGLHLPRSHHHPCHHLQL